MTELKTYEFMITKGVTCAACIERLEKALVDSKLCHDYSTNLALKILTVKTTHSPKHIINELRKLGFGLKVKKNFSDLIKEEIKNTNKRIKNFILLLVLGIPVVILGTFFPHARLSMYTQFVLTTFMIFFPSKDLYLSGFHALKKKSVNMDALVSLSTMAAWIYSSYVLFAKSLSNHVYFETAAMLLVVIYLGKTIEDKVRIKSTELIQNLYSLCPKVARLASDSSTMIPVEQLKIGDVILVKSGETLAADGVVSHGKSHLNIAFLTGESKPITVSENSRVFAGSINGDSALEVTVTSVFAEWEFSKIIQLVTQTLTQKTPLQRLADKIVHYFSPVLVLIALVSFIGNYFYNHNFETSLLSLIAVLIVACPCALGLATPVAIVVATGRAAKLGILIKEAASLEILSQVDTAVLDKTGTLTIGEVNVSLFIPYNKTALNTEVIFNAVYQAEKKSSHPFSQSICQWIEKNYGVANLNLNLSSTEKGGQGLQISINYENKTHELFIGRPLEHLLDKTEQKFIHETLITLEDLLSPIFIHTNGKLFGIFLIGDKIRPEAKKFIDDLKKHKIKPIMLSGDDDIVCRQVCSILQISEYHPRKTPAEKLHFIEELKHQKKKTLMVGDGINDSAALIKADVGIAMGSGTDIAASSAQIVLKHNSLHKVSEALDLSKETISIIKQNLFLSFSYNIILIPLAAFGRLNPMLSGAFMAASSIIVVLNTLRLRTHRK